MKTRLQAILHNYQLTAAEFAKIIGVNPSGLSHILSGNRNNLSMDTILKILKVYPDINLEWLILGKGNMLKDDIAASQIFPEQIDERTTNNFSDDKPQDSIDKKDYRTGQEIDSDELKDKSKIEKIIIVYSDNSFEELKHR